MKTNQAVMALAALAQESRLKVFRLLVEAGEEGLAAGEIAEHLDLPPATLSFHLKELAATGLIAPERHGRRLIYSMQPGIMNELLQFLIRDCCQGRPELCQPDVRKNKLCCGAVNERKRSRRTRGKPVKPLPSRTR